MAPRCALHRGCKQQTQTREDHMPTKVMALVLPLLASVAALLLAAQPASAQQGGREIVLKQVAPELHFLYDFAGSNVLVMTTAEGVLVVDARTHPKLGQDMIERIRRISDKPIKWVINSHFHGDHHMGNA